MLACHPRVAAVEEVGKSSGASPGTPAMQGGAAFEAVGDPRQGGMEIMCPPGTVEQVRAACAHDSAHDSSHIHPHVSRRALLSAGGLAAVASLLPGKAARAADVAYRDGRLQDLTYVFGPTFPVATGPAPTRSTLFTIERDG